MICVLRHSAGSSDLTPTVGITVPHSYPHLIEDTEAQRTVGCIQGHVLQAAAGLNPRSLYP